VQAEDGRTFGPVAHEQLDTWFAERRITAGCFLWQDGDKQMRYASDVYPQLADIAADDMPEIVTTTKSVVSRGAPDASEGGGGMNEMESFRCLGKKLIASSEYGAVTDYNQARLLHATTPNVSNAWTHVVPVLAKYGNCEGKRSLFGHDKGEIAYRDLEEKLHLVVLGLYGDGLVSQGASTDECLLAVLRSLVSFKEVYPNWEDAYSAGYEVFVEGRSRICRCLAAHQRSIEAGITSRKTDVVAQFVPSEEQIIALLTYARLFTHQSANACRETTPYLWQLIGSNVAKDEKLNLWAYFNYVAIMWWALRAAQMDFPSSIAKHIERTLHREIAKSDRTMVGAMSDLDQFLDTLREQCSLDAHALTDVEIVKFGVGTWLFLNLTGRGLKNDETELAGLLGAMSHYVVGNYWQELIPSADSAGK